MELINATRMNAAFNVGMEPSGRELLVIVVKGTFRMAQGDGPAGRLTLHEQQVPLVMADAFTGDPGRSAPRYEADFAPYKQRCDILLNGSAHAPGGRPVTRLEVGVRIGEWSKTFAVVGQRLWELGLRGLRAGAVQPFVRTPISYDVAFGGSDLRHEDPAQHAAYMPNPVGRGFHKHVVPAWVDGAPLPSTEESDRPVVDATGSYRPMAFGPVGRGWEPRFRFAGTYDEEWLEHRFPFLPADFDPRYYQAAPADQQVPLGFFDAGQDIALAHLTPEGQTRFRVPPLAAPVSVFPKRGQREDYRAVLDTVVIEPDEQRFSLTWRVARPLKQDVFEIARVQVGSPGREFWHHDEAAAAAASSSRPGPRA